MSYRRFLAATVAVCAFLVSACGGVHLTRLPTSATPDQVVLGWFAAENAQDAQLLDAYYPGSSQATAASASHIRCHTVSQSARQAVVSCSFDAHNWDGGGDDEKYAGWSFYLQHPDGQGWQIHDAGYA